MDVLRTDWTAVLFPAVCAHGSRTCDVRVGDVLDVTATVQVSTTYSHAVMVGYFLKVSNTDNGTPQAGTLLCRAMATNISLSVHHLPVSVAGTYGCPRGPR